jgi:hypothetical protein
MRLQVKPAPPKAKSTNEDKMAYLTTLMRTQWKNKSAYRLVDMKCMFILCIKLKKLMKNNFLFKALTVSILVIGLASCKKDKDEPTNVITDANGIETTMNWSLNSGGTATATDLDVELYKGTGASKVSTGYGSSSFTDFENFDMPGSLTDGDYTISVSYYTVTENGKMNFVFKGLATPASVYEVKDIAFSTTDEDAEKDIIRINKSGNKYTFTKL